MSSTLPTVSRRHVLLGTAALALLGGTLTTACGSTPPLHEMDALIGQLERARDDSTLAGNAAAAAPPKVAAVLTVVASQRAAHAQALTDEITRISGEAPPTSTSASATFPATSPATSSPGATSVPPPKPPTAADVVAALKQSAEGASLLAIQQSGYRAGLLGSIAAACTACATVALADAGPTR
ncbi:hypothetical protein [Mycolicibacterium hodleri]|uniref:Tat pathway signal protein n=1 Tax=Mycolicibacterium hodleri TaxID=49897 RepID=A0A502EIT3_9MYCO|nr:hypothetical protein [Mycolicibacterium hodleri]TPG36959.1 hypothetical protein EAH80_03485 [Mycolicibacterium hodleri]